MAACVLAAAPTHFSISRTHSLTTWTDGGGLLGFSFQKTYPPAIEQLLRPDYQSLSAKDRRRFAAVEALKLGHGGSRSLANVLGCDPHTGTDGRRALKQLPADPAEPRVRKPGGGRKKTEEKHPEVIEQVQDAITDQTAGDPRRQDVRWTEAPPQEIAERLPAPAVCAGPRVVRRLRDRLGFARRQIAKVLPGGASPHRGEPFRHRAALIHRRFSRPETHSH
jgi:hypothetical protein